MKVQLSEDHRRKLKQGLVWLAFVATLAGVFFLGLVLVNNNENIQSFTRKRLVQTVNKEIFGFAPFWSLSKMGSIDWNVLTTFAYFSLPVNVDGSIDRNSYEWKVFNGRELNNLFEKARNHKVKRVVTLTQMDAGVISTFLDNPDAWEKIANESVDVLRNKNLEGVNIDFEYIPSDNNLKQKFSDFIGVYTKILRENLNNPNITVSVLASSVRFNRIYDIKYLASQTDGVFMMAYDFYYPGSDSIGPSSPLFGYNDGKGPFWYDVATAVGDFLKVADPKKIILGIPYYGWNYPAYSPAPKTKKVYGAQASATTQERAYNDKLLLTTPVGGWDDTAKVSWRGYWDLNGWNVVYMEDKKSLSYKFDFAKEKSLGGIGIWALGFDSGDDTFWSLIRDKFTTKYLAFSQK